LGDFSSLVNIQNEEENAFLMEQINSAEALSPVWIGLNDRQSENVFRWSDNSKPKYTNWMQDNPRNRQYKDCTVLLGMRKDGAWTTELCSETRRYICKRNKGLLHRYISSFLRFFVCGMRAEYHTSRIRNIGVLIFVHVT
jgi:hypothetical protein